MRLLQHQSLTNWVLAQRSMLHLSQLLEIIAHCHDLGHDLRRFYQDLLFFGRHLVLAKLGPEARHLADIADQEWDGLQKLAGLT
ncbi:MAG: hypothetical protein MUE56_09370, partial [Ignavibacteria bacterium]|nr:hypothetical protein [Ignavibacteria bacterium]